MEERLFGPLGMDSCGFGPPASPGETDQPWGHNSSGPVDPATGYADNPPALGPAGTVHCSLKSWAAFAAEHVAGSRGESDFLEESTWQQLHTVRGSDYALGWVVVERNWANGDTLSHTGSNTMFLADVWAAPGIDEAYLTVTNIYSGPALSTLDGVISALIGLD